jgi:hypothetical protein
MNRLSAPHHMSKTNKTTSGAMIGQVITGHRGNNRGIQRLLRRPAAPDGGMSRAP